jgi:hypothetical protein
VFFALALCLDFLRIKTDAGFGHAAPSGMESIFFDLIFSALPKV